MQVTPGRRRVMAAVAISMAGVMAATGCSGGSDDDDGDTITLVVDTFGVFGYDELYRQFEEENPGIRIEARGENLGVGDYTQQLQQALAAGEGAGDVVAIEEGVLVDFLATPEQFVDLRDYLDVEEIQARYLPWVWEAGFAGDQLVGLGTDIGSMGLCFRRDLFEQAGLPTDRQQLSEQLQTWDDYIALGQQFMQANTGAAFIDGATNVYNATLMQFAGEGPGYTYFNEDDEFVMEENPAVRQAFDLTLQMIEAGLSAGIQTFSEEWTAGFQNNAFATVACPAWMLGQIAENHGDAGAGLWDVTTIPGSGGNWGGSWLAVTTQSEHPEEAARLVEFLTRPEGQLAAFEAAGRLPSLPELLQSDEVLAMTNEYFSNAPVGQLFAEGAQELRPVYLGADNQAVRTEVENVLRAVEQGNISPQDAWNEAVDNARNVVD